jgi:tetratricopeptide (TPR) repeat protein
LKNLSKFEDSKKFVQLALTLDPKNETFEILEKYLTDYEKIDAKKSLEFKEKGNSLFAENKLNEAMEEYNQAIEFNPIDPTLYHNRALVFQMLKKQENSKLDYHKSLEIDPKYVKARFKLATIYFEEKKDSECLNVLREGLEMNPKDSNLLPMFNIVFKRNQTVAMENLTTAQELYFEKEFDKALNLCNDSLNKFIEIGDKQGLEKGYNLLGSIYFSLNNFSRASICYNACLKFQQELSDAEGQAKTLNNLGTLCYTFHDDQHAVLYFEEAFKILKSLKKDYSHVLKNLISACLVSKNYKKALESNFELLKISKEEDNISIYQSIGRCYKLSSDYEKAIDVYLKAYELSKSLNDEPSEIQSLIGVGNCYEMLREFEKSIEYYGWSLEKCNETKNMNGKGETYENLGWVYFEMKEFEKSLSNFENSLIIFQNIKNDEKISTLKSNIDSVKSKIK